MKSKEKVLEYIQVPTLKQKSLNIGITLTFGTIVGILLAATATFGQRNAHAIAEFKQSKIALKDDRHTNPLGLAPNLIVEPKNAFKRPNSPFSFNVSIPPHFISKNNFTVKINNKTIKHKLKKINKPQQNIEAVLALNKKGG